MHAYFFIIPADLLQPLDTYVSTLPVPTRVVRTGSRVGLIRARLEGARVALGSVLVFLDAHVEASPGWLVPMLAEIAGDRRRVVMPGKRMRRMRFYQRCWH